MAEITAQERMANFAKATRQNHQQLPAQMVTTGNTTMEFTLPKARLLSKLWLDVEAQVTVEGTINTDYLNLHRLIRRITLDLNNGFSPVLASAEDIATMNALTYTGWNQFDSVVAPSVNEYEFRKHSSHMYAVDSNDGKTFTFNFFLPIPVCIDEKNLLGMILLQSPETVVNLSLDIGNGMEIFTNEEVTSAKVDYVKAKCMVETFSIPSQKIAFPELSVLKLVNSRTDAFPGAGQNIVKLATGTIYRRLVLRFEDADGKPMNANDFNGNIELIFNQSDTTYSVDPAMLRKMNLEHYGYSLPDGVYAFDFAYNGVPALGGVRDYIDTALLNEFWCRFNTTTGGKVHIISENIARLK